MHFVIYRYDYENCDAAPCNQMIADLEGAIASQKLNKQSFSAEGKSYTVALADNFHYEDPVDKSVASKQVRVIFIKIETLDPGKKFIGRREQAESLSPLPLVLKQKIQSQVMKIHNRVTLRNVNNIYLCRVMAPKKNISLGTIAQ